MLAVSLVDSSNFKITFIDCTFMSINIIQLNGLNSSLNYENFEKDVKKSLEKNCNEATLTIFNNFPIDTTPEIQTDIVIALCI